MWRFSLCLHVVLLRCPANVLGDSAPSSLADRCQSLRSLTLLQAALHRSPPDCHDGVTIILGIIATSCTALKRSMCRKFCYAVVERAKGLPRVK